MKQSTLHLLASLKAVGDPLDGVRELGSDVLDELVVLELGEELLHPLGALGSACMSLNNSIQTSCSHCWGTHSELEALFAKLLLHLFLWKMFSNFDVLINCPIARHFAQPSQIWAYQPGSC